jgi:hypothetical protein
MTSVAGAVGSVTPTKMAMTVSGLGRERWPRDHLLE